MNDSSNSLKNSQERLAQDFRTVLDDAQDLLRHATDEAGKGYSDARQRLQASVDSARHGIEGLEDALLDGARRASRSADGYVRAHPWETIAVGAGIGLLLGSLISLRGEFPAA